MLEWTNKTVESVDYPLSPIFIGISDDRIQTPQKENRARKDLVKSHWIILCRMYKYLKINRSFLPLLTFVLFICFVFYCPLLPSSLGEELRKTPWVSTENPSPPL